MTTQFQPPQPQYVPPRPSKKGMPVWGWVLIGTGVFVLALCGIGAVAASNAPRSGVLAAETAATATSPASSTPMASQPAPPPVVATTAPAAPPVAATTAPPPTKAYTPPAPKAGTVSQQNAVRKAESYLKSSAFSRTGLIDQLEYEGFSNSDATYAVDHIQVNWNEQAAKKAQSYLKSSAFSRSGLIDQLEYEGFTASQAEYGVNSVGL